MLKSTLIKKKKNQGTATLVRIMTNESTGLTREQALMRMRDGYANTTIDPPSKSVRQIVFNNLFTYFNLIFFVLAACVITVGAYNDLLFLPVVIANISIGIIQEIKAKRILDNLSLLTVARVHVIRDGKEMETTPENLVVDDVVIFRPGSQICADATVLSGEVTLSEALVTGESDEIIKNTGNKLISGSYVISGSCRARLERVGADSFVSKLTIDAKKAKKRFRTGMMRSLTLLIKIIGLIILPVGIVMFYKHTNILGMSVRDGVVRTTAALIGMIPEGLYLLVSVALAVSVIRLGKKKTLVREMSSIETLARVDVLCVDKTGTITENEMRVTDIVQLNPEYDKRTLTGIMNDITCNLETDNNTMLALKSYFSGNDYRRAQRVVPFSSANKRSSVSFGQDENYMIGAPEFILDQQFRQSREKADEYASQGYRVLLLASDDGQGTGTIPLALVLLTNPIRPQVKATFEYFERQGVAIKVISGDNPITVSNAARHAGIPMAEAYIDATQLDTPEKLRDAALKHTVFGRVTPEQKRQLVLAIKKSGHTVAMTGDGVNDVLALKEADCSIAMASGSDIASRVSQLVLLDSNFASMPLVVAEGRRVINNIERSASLFLVKNIYSFFLALISITAVFGYPIEPSQLSLINLVTIGIPSFVLALEPNTNIVKGKFLRNVLYRALPAALTNLFLTVGVVLFSLAFDLDNAQTSTVAALLVGVVGLMMLFRVCRPFDIRRIILWISMCSAFIFCIVFFKDFFSISMPDTGSLLIFAVFTLLAYPVMNYISIWIDGAGELFTAIKIKLKTKITSIIDRGKRRI